VSLYYISTVKDLYWNCISIHRFSTRICKRTKKKKDRMVFYSQRSQITSGMFLAILTGTPIIIYRKKSWTHHTGRGESLAIQHPSQEVARAREMLSPQQLALTWAQSGSTLGPPLLVEQGAQVPMICPCPLGQPHLFTRCSVTSSSCDS